jgi:hypothetical protein
VIDDDAPLDHVERPAPIAEVVGRLMLVQEQDTPAARCSVDHVVRGLRHPGRNDPDGREGTARDVRGELTGLQGPYGGAVQRLGVEQARGAGALPEQSAADEFQARTELGEREQRAEHVVVVHSLPYVDDVLRGHLCTEVHRRPPQDGVDTAGTGAQPDRGHQPGLLQSRDDLSQRTCLKGTARSRAGQNHRDDRLVDGSPRIGGSGAPRRGGWTLRARRTFGASRLCIGLRRPAGRPLRCCVHDPSAFDLTFRTSRNRFGPPRRLARQWGVGVV